MPRNQPHTIIRRLCLVLALTAFAVPATASAHPVGAFTQKASPSFVPAAQDNGRVIGPGTTGLGPTTPVRPVPQNTVVGDSGFDRSDALVGAAVTVTFMALAIGGALTLRRQHRFGYR
jgi:hypothetical protein